MGIGQHLPSLPRQHHPHGLKQDFDIQSQRPVVDVFQIQFHNLVKIHNLASAADLPQPRESRRHTDPAPVVGIVLLKLTLSGRPCAHQAHVSLYDIKKLGQLVNACLSDKFTYLRDTRVVLHLKHEPLHLV